MIAKLGEITGRTGRPGGGAFGACSGRGVFLNHGFGLVTISRLMRTNPSLHRINLGSVPSADKVGLPVEIGAFMSWYSNPWVVGIIGSIPGGFLVNWLTGLVLRKKENREYLQKVIGANREVIYAVRPGISEGEIPSREVMNSLRNATARRYGVDPSDLYSGPEIAEELTKEVMDSSFISSSQKTRILPAPLITGSGRHDTIDG